MDRLRVAYFTMEIGLRSDMPTYAGGLGMLAADIMRSCADMAVPTACITMRWKHGYMQQKINPNGSQDYMDVDWDPSDFLEKLDNRVTVNIEGREVYIGVWKYEIEGHSGHKVPVYFLDTDLEENDQQDRDITNYLYGGGGSTRIKQEAVLGIGGVRMLRSLGYHDIGTFHMNEGHSAFLTLELLKERNYQDDAVKPTCAFTTHTPVKAGHDTFSYDEAHRVLGDMLPWHIKDLAGEDELSMTLLAMNLSHYTCGVSRIHAEVTRKMFPGHDIDYITNGIHHLTWVCDPIAELLDTYCSGWKEDPGKLLTAYETIDDNELWEAHIQAKRRLIEEINNNTITEFTEDDILIATARRVVPYKRPELIYENLDRLIEIACEKLQLVHAGNAHPSDSFSQGVIQRMVQRANNLKDCVRIVYLENYNPDLAKLMVSGADVWLNTPKRRHEASGTSGMKACLNGVLNVSTLDGWWIEGYEMDYEAGWRIGPLASAVTEKAHAKLDAEDVYTQLQYEVMPEYYNKDKGRWTRRMKRAIELVGHFNTHRCVKEYLEKAWVA